MDGERNRIPGQNSRSRYAVIVEDIADNFGSSQSVGATKTLIHEGKHSLVYKCILPSGEIVAIKEVSKVTVTQEPTKNTANEIVAMQALLDMTLAVRFLTYLHDQSVRYDGIL